MYFSKHIHNSALNILFNRVEIVFYLHLAQFTITRLKMFLSFAGGLLTV